MPSPTPKPNPNPSLVAFLSSSSPVHTPQSTASTSNAVDLSRIPLPEDASDKPLPGDDFFSENQLEQALFNSLIVNTHPETRLKTPRVPARGGGTTTRSADEHPDYILAGKQARRQPQWLAQMAHIDGDIHNMKFAFAALV
jgi:hypothetical protein